MAANVVLGVAGYVAGKLLKPLIFRAMAALGIGIISYYGADELLIYASDLIATNAAGLPSDLVQSLGFVNFDKYVTITGSAYLSAITFNQISKTIGVR